MTARAVWKELCMDTGGGRRLGEFWAAALGLRAGDDPDADVVGDEEGQGIAMCPVPEPKTVKHRVHIDVHAGSVAELEALGATVLVPEGQDGIGWTVLADPEGGEFCAFLRPADALPAYRLYELVVDAADAKHICEWWADLFGVEAKAETEGDWVLEGVPGVPFECIVFGPVPEPKTVKNRIHWDVYGDPATLLAAGATMLREPGDPATGAGISWHVMADPEGNEFCVFQPR